MNIWNKRIYISELCNGDLTELNGRKRACTRFSRAHEREEGGKKKRTASNFQFHILPWWTIEPPANCNLSNLDLHRRTLRHGTRFPIGRGFLLLQADRTPPEMWNFVVPPRIERNIRNGWSWLAALSMERPVESCQHFDVPRQGLRHVGSLETITPRSL